ncbi:MAG: hypothetical protein AAGC44_15680 [Planctomycetota bacterium]
MKNTNLTMLSLLLILTLGLPHAQAEEPKTRGEDGDVLTPLTIGNTWVYEDMDNSFITTDRIEGVVLFDGHPWHLLRSYEHEAGRPANTAELVSDNFWLTLKDGYEWDAWAELNGGDDDEEFVAEELQLTSLSRYYRYPATLGETYKPNADDQTVVMTVTSLSEKITTKAGEFDCIVYKETSTEDEDYAFTSWVAPGVGIIKNAGTDEDGEPYGSALVSYTLVEED